MHRFFADCSLHVGLALALPADTARHVQVMRLQPGDDLTLFNGLGGSHTAMRGRALPRRKGDAVAAEVGSLRPGR